MKYNVDGQVYDDKNNDELQEFEEELLEYLESFIKLKGEKFNQSVEERIYDIIGYRVGSLEFLEKYNGEVVHNALDSYTEDLEKDEYCNEVEYEIHARKDDFNIKINVKFDVELGIIDYENMNVEVEQYEKSNYKRRIKYKLYSKFG